MGKHKSASPMARMRQAALGAWTSPTVHRAESWIRSQTRLVILLGIVPTAAAALYAFFVGDPRGWLIAGLLVLGWATVFAVQALWTRMSRTTKAALGSCAVVALILNPGSIWQVLTSRQFLLTYASLATILILATRYLPDNKTRIAAAGIVLAGWAGLASTPMVQSQHATVDASMVDLSQTVGDAHRGLVEWWQQQRPGQAEDGPPAANRPG